MTQRSIFYAGTSADPRSYDAPDFMRFFRALVTSGVVPNTTDNRLAVSAPGTGMILDIATGEVWVYGAHAKSDAIEHVTIPTADPTNPRIDLVVAKNTVTTGITFEVHAGTPAASPVAPDPTQNSTVYEISLARVLVGAGVTTIAANKVTDERTYFHLKYIPQASLTHPAAIDLGGEQINNLADGLASTDALNKGQMDDTGYSPAAIGVVRPFGTSTIPSGFLLCNGQAVSRTTYANLFAIIGTKFGSGDGSTTFNVPNLIDKFIVSYNAADSDFSAVGNTGGAATVVLSVANLPAHTHTLVWKYLSDWQANPDTKSTGNVGYSGSTNYAGSSSAHNNLPPYIKMALGVRY